MFQMEVYEKAKNDKAERGFSLPVRAAKPSEK